MSSEGFPEPDAHVRRPSPSRAMVVSVLGVMGVLIALTVWARYDPDRPGLLALDLVLGAAAWLGSPLLLWRPVGTTLVLTALAVLSPAVTPPATLGTLQVAERRRFPVAVAVGAAGVLAHLVQGAWRRPVDELPYVWWAVLCVIAYGALVGWGALVQARRALIDSLRERARRAEAEQSRRVAEARMLERTRIAREMHDVLAHRLSLLATYAGALEYRPDSSPERLAQAAGVVRAGVHQALEELREVIGVLREDDLTGTPEDEAPGGTDRDAGPADVGRRPQPGLADLARLVEEARSAGQRVEFVENVHAPEALPAAGGRTAYRVVQEALTNARKHAPGRPVRVRLEGRPGERLTIDVRNRLAAPGSTGSATPGTGTGLIGLGERVHLTGGRLDHEIAEDEFRLHVELPWPA